tara:strand:- start:735 stop:1133 length:399 start_codon:yes stop_codon:yes gene_type:complete
MKIKSSQELVAEAMLKIETLEPNIAKELWEKNQCTLIDIRDIREIWKEGTVKESMHIPRGMLEFWLDPTSPYYKPEKFGETKKIVLFCAAGLRSALATKSLNDMGYKNVAHVREGFGGLKRAGAKIEEKEKK